MLAFSHLEFSVNLLSFFISVANTYNERGWLRNSISGLFSLQLDYQTAGTAQYNGNISRQLWGAGSNPALNTFSYNYDKLNRLTQAVSPGLGEAITYDVMGNITQMVREGSGTNNYTLYAGNQLKTISGFVNSTYDYNDNGNLWKDNGKNLTLTYNHLNLPAKISGSVNMSYVYDASGSKLRKEVAGSVTNYIDGIEYKPNGQIDIIHTEEGLARNNSGTYSYEYSLSNHLCNNRTTFYKNPATQALEVLQRDNYSYLFIFLAVFMSSAEPRLFCIWIKEQSKSRK